MIPRLLAKLVHEDFSIFPAVTILGPRQIGKTTLAKAYAKHHDTVHFDLQDRTTRNNIDEDPKSYLQSFSHKLVILDEVQQVPDLFRTLRILIDDGLHKGAKNPRFLLLASASQLLLKQTSESLAGRTSYLQLTGFLPQEVTSEQKDLASVHKLWTRGGFPNSFIADDDRKSVRFRQSLIQTILEKDIPNTPGSIPTATTKKLWNLLSVVQGEPLNISKLAGSLHLSGSTVSRYIDFLEDLMLIRKLQPWADGNMKKRLVKSPRVYVRDSGMLHALLGIYSFEKLLTHSIFGKSWEGFVIESIINTLSEHWFSYYYYRSVSGSEIDLLIEVQVHEFIAVEIKSGSKFTISKGFHEACRDLKISHKYVIYSGDMDYTKEDTQVMALGSFLKMVSKKDF